MSGIMIVMVVIMVVAMFGAGHKGVMSGHVNAATDTPEQVVEGTMPDKSETKDSEVKP